MQELGLSCSIILVQIEPHLYIIAFKMSYSAPIKGPSSSAVDSNGSYLKERRGLNIRIAIVVILALAGAAMIGTGTCGYFRLGLLKAMITRDAVILMSVGVGGLGLATILGITKSTSVDTTAKRDDPPPPESPCFEKKGAYPTPPQQSPDMIALTPLNNSKLPTNCKLIVDCYPLMPLYITKDCPYNDYTLGNTHQMHRSSLEGKDVVIKIHYPSLGSFRAANPIYSLPQKHPDDQMQSSLQSCLGYAKYRLKLQKPHLTQCFGIVYIEALNLWGTICEPIEETPSLKFESFTSLKELLPFLISVAEALKWLYENNLNCGLAIRSSDVIIHPVTKKAIFLDNLWEQREESSHFNRCAFGGMLQNISMSEPALEKLGRECATRSTSMNDLSWDMVIKSLNAIILDQPNPPVKK